MASKRRIRRNACTGKVKYDTIEDCKRGMHNLWKKLGVKTPLLPYRCKFCGKFHFGHSTRRST